ncbi:C25 family cysteine peptidase [Calditrichota bacterium]
MKARFLTITYLLCFVTLLINPLGVEAASEAYQVEIMQTSESGFTADFTITKPELKIKEADDGGDRLWVDLPGATLDFESTGPALPVFTHMIAVPDGYKVRAMVKSRDNYELNASALYSNRDGENRTVRRADAKPVVEVGEAGWMRWLKVAPVVIHPAAYDYDNNIVEVASSMQVEFEFIRDFGSNTGIEIDPDRYWSASFDELFREIVLNYDQSDIVPSSGKVRHRGTYLIITDGYLSTPQVTTVHEFADWKRRKGFNVVISDMIEDGVSAEEVKSYILDAYENWERPPEFVLLLGDVNQADMHLPTFTIINSGTDERNVTDHPYSLMNDDDYFSDIFVGRISCPSGNPNDARYALNRVIQQERNPLDLVDDTDIFHRATIFAGNYGEGGAPILSPVETAMWLEERLTELDYDVESFYYRHPGDNISPEPIAESLSRGVNIVAYRGWADATGPHYPRFHKEHWDLVSSNPWLPIGTFFVCNVGDFGNNTNPYCFLEDAIRQGSFRSPKGFVWAYGPSDLHTKTQFNNPNLAGFYSGIMYNNIRLLSVAAFRAKMEIYRGFPNDAASGGAVEFYFHVYNVIGDPEFNFYFDAPYELSVNHDQSYPLGTTSLPIVVKREDNDDPVKGAFVTVRWGADTTDRDNSVTVETDGDGVALVPVSFSEAGDWDLTVIAKQAAPYLEYGVISTQTAKVNVSAWSIGDQGLAVGELIRLDLTLKNFSQSQAGNVTARLKSPYEISDEVSRGVEITRNHASFGNIAAGGTASADTAYEFIVSPGMTNLFEIPFTLKILYGQTEVEGLIRIPVHSSNMVYKSHAFTGGTIEPGQTKDLSVTLTNWGQQAGISGLKGRLHTHDEAVTVQDAEAVFGDVDAGGEAACSDDPFSITVHDDSYIGRQVLMRMELMNDSDEQLKTIYFNIMVGTPDENDPLGPDGYGYFAYEDIDDDEMYTEAPEYDWIELDPNEGGDGATLHELADDESFTMDLPFSFTFYGRDFDEITICSNGWVSFVPTWMANFRNWGIPSPLGPHTMIAPFWEDLVGDSIGLDAQEKIIRDNLDVYTRYDRAEGRFVIQWNSLIARTSNREVDVTFQLVLFDPSLDQYMTQTGDGEILVQYKEIENVDRGNELNYATIGIQDWNHARGLELTFADRYPASIAIVENGRAIKFTTDMPDNLVSVRDTPAIQLPAAFKLSEPYPNPFNSRTAVEFSLPEMADVRLSLWDTEGRFVKDIVIGSRQAGVHTATLHAEDIPSGMYMLRLESGAMLQHRKVVLVR